MKKVLVPLAAGAEEMETVIVVDVLRRAGLEVVLAGLDSADAVACSRGVRIVPDCSLAEAGSRGPYDLVALPGGAASETLAGSAVVQNILRGQEKAGRAVAAICAAPIALVSAGVGAGKRMTSHPGVRARVETHGTYVEERVVRDGLLVTSRGPGTAMEFALALVEMMLDKATAEKVAGPMIVK